MAKIVPNIYMDFSEIGGELAGPGDMRHFSLKGVRVGIFDARGKKLTLQFLEGATFRVLDFDETTQMYNDDGERVDFRVVTLKSNNLSQFQPIGKG